MCAIFSYSTHGVELDARHNNTLLSKISFQTVVRQGFSVTKTSLLAFFASQAHEIVRIIFAL
jgi:RNase P protein component